MIAGKYMRRLLYALSVFAGIFSISGNQFGLSPQEVEASAKCNLFSDQVSLSFVEKMGHFHNFHIRYPSSGAQAA